MVPTRDLVPAHLPVHGYSLGTHPWPQPWHVHGVQCSFFSLSQVEAPGLSGNDLCPPGFFCHRGAGSPVTCPAGFYSPVSDLHSERASASHAPQGTTAVLELSLFLEAELCDAG